MKYAAIAIGVCLVSATFGTIIGLGLGVALRLIGIW